MKTRVGKWGNSLAVRIPRSFAAETRIEADTLVELSIVEGKLVLTPVERPEENLEALLARVTEQNRHSEVDAGPPVGSEAW
jgi:antitoxin MazE